MRTPINQNWGLATLVFSDGTQQGIKVPYPFLPEVAYRVPKPIPMESFKLAKAGEQDIPQVVKQEYDEYRFRIHSWDEGYEEELGVGRYIHYPKAVYAQIPTKR